MTSKPSYEELEKRIIELENKQSIHANLIGKCNLYLDISDTGVWSWNLETGEIVLDDKFYDILGYQPGELPMTMDKWEKYYHPDDFDQMILRCRDYLNGKTTKFESEHRILDKNGQWRWVLSKGKVLEKDTNEGLRQFYGVALDITRQKQAEAEFAKMFDMSLDLICVADITTIKFLKINRAFTEILGYSEQELMERSFLEFIHPDDVDATNKIVTEELQAGKKVINFENRYRCKDGSYCWLSWVSHPVPEKGITYAVARDITQIKQTAKKLHDSEKRYKSLFNSTNDGICLHEIIYKKNKPADYRILDINPKYEELTGIRKEDAVGALGSEVYKTGQAPYLDVYAKVADTGKTVTFETYFPPMGKHFLISVFCPQKHQFATVFQDITERKKIENQIQHASKMDAMGTLAGGIAHDFNNMLGVMIGNISYVLSCLEDNDDLYEALSDAQDGAKQAQSLTQQLLTFSKGGAPIKSVTDLNSLIKESANFVTRGTNVKCEFNFDKDLWAADVDKGQINQVINNLVINATQAMPNGGHIRIKTENAQLDMDSILPLTPGKYIKISVEDQGIGISEKHLANIFDPFFTTKQKGSGIGLTTCYSIVKKHEGYINVYSELDRGTIFNVYLPATLDQAQLEEVFEELDHKGKGRILVMDDQVNILKMIGRMLKNMGYETSVVEDGRQAIEIYREAFDSQTPFDAVILDLTVPGGMGGAKTMPELLRIDPDVKAIVSSGYSNDPIMAHYEDYGFCGVVPKPYTKAQLSEVLNRISRKKE